MMLGFDRKELFQMVNFMLGGFALVVLFEMAVQYFPPQAVPGVTYHFVNGSIMMKSVPSDDSPVSDWLYNYQPSGQTIRYDSGEVAVWVDEGMPGLMQNLAIRHENCHARQDLSERYRNMTSDQMELECYTVMWFP